MADRLNLNGSGTPIIGQKTCPYLSFVAPNGLAGVGCLKHACEVYDRANDQCSHLTTALAMTEIKAAMTSMAESAKAMTEIGKKLSTTP